VTETVSTSNPNRNRLVAVVGGGLVLLLAALVLPKVLFGGGGGDDLGAPPEAAAPGSTTTTVAEAVPDLGVLPESFSTKNPFTPLVDTTPAAAATDEVPGATDTTGTGTEPTDVPADTTGGTTTEPDRESARFSLVEVYAGADGAPVASVQVDGSSYTVGEGDTFAGYSVVSLSRESGSGTFTDPQGDTFTARTGESQLK
jgi:hypothetical protein